MLRAKVRREDVDGGASSCRISIPHTNRAFRSDTQHMLSPTSHKNPNGIVSKSVKSALHCATQPKLWPCASLSPTVCLLVLVLIEFMMIIGWDIIDPATKWKSDITRNFNTLWSPIVHVPALLFYTLIGHCHLIAETPHVFAYPRAGKHAAWPVFRTPSGSPSPTSSPPLYRADNRNWDVLVNWVVGGGRGCDVLSPDSWHVSMEVMHSPSDNLSGRDRTTYTGRVRIYRNISHNWLGRRAISVHFEGVAGGQYTLSLSFPHAHAGWTLLPRQYSLDLPISAAKLYAETTEKVVEKDTMGAAADHALTSKGDDAINAGDGEREGESAVRVVRVGIIGDSQWGRQMYQHLNTLMLGNEPQLVFHLGDVVQNAAKSVEWDRFWVIPKSKSMEIASNAAGFTRHTRIIPCMMVLGNHDVVHTRRATVADAQDSQMPSPPPLLSQPPLWFVHAPHPLYYAVTLFSAVRFIVLDSYVHRSGQSEWLEAELGGHECKSAAFVVVMTHMPPYTEIWVPEFWHGDKREKEWGDIVFREWDKLFVKHGVDLVVGGHSHVYQRGSRNGVTYVIAGGGGGALEQKELNHVADYAMYTATEFEYHYALLDIVRDNSHRRRLTLEFRALNNMDNVIDRFNLSRRRR